MKVREKLDLLLSGKVTYQQLQELEEQERLENEGNNPPVPNPEPAPDEPVPNPEPAPAEPDYKAQVEELEKKIKQLQQDKIHEPLNPEPQKTPEELLGDIVRDFM